MLLGGTRPDAKVSGLVVLSDIGTESKTRVYWIIRFMLGLRRQAGGLPYSNLNDKYKKSHLKSSYSPSP